MREDSLLRTIIEGIMEGENKRKTVNGVTGLNDERASQQIQG